MEQPTRLHCERVVPGMDEDEDNLFLESLIAEANRSLDTLKAVRCQMEEEQGETSLRVAYRDTNQSVCRLSREEMSALAYKVRELQGLLFDGAN